MEAAPAGATVTDIGSTKANLVRSVEAADRARFVGGHPVCGSEARGAGQRAGAICRRRHLLPDAGARHRPAPLRAQVTVIGALGARPVADRRRAPTTGWSRMTSHLPHVMANLLATQAAASTIDGHDPLAAVGGSFRDMTRVAGANAAHLGRHLPRQPRRPPGRPRRAPPPPGRRDRGARGRRRRAAGALDRRVRGRARRRDAAAYATSDGGPFVVRVFLADRPGSIAGITQALGAARISIRGLTLEHRISPEPAATCEIVVAGAEAADAAVEILDEQGYAATAAPLEDGEGEG